MNFLVETPELFWCYSKPLNCPHFNILRLRQNGRHFPDNIFKCILLNENVWISLKISLNFVPNVQINNIQVLVKIMPWCRPGDKLLSESMMVSLLTHICVTRPQWRCFSTWSQGLFFLSMVEQRSQPMREDVTYITSSLIGLDLAQ